MSDISLPAECDSCGGGDGRTTDQRLSA